MNRSSTLHPLCPVLAALALGATFTAAAQTPTDGQWHGSLSGGATLSSGNAPSVNLNVVADAVRATASDKITLDALSAYGRAKLDGRNRKTNDLARAQGRYDRDFTGAMFGFGSSELEASRVRGLDLRYAVDGGVGYHLIQREGFTLDAFGGGGYSNTDYTDGTTRSGLELLLGEESVQRLGESNSFKQRFTLYPGTGGMGSRASFDAALVTAIAQSWTLNVGGSWRWASKPAPGLRKADSLVTVGVGFRY